MGGRLKQQKFKSIRTTFAIAIHRSSTAWNEELEDWWFKNIGEDLGHSNLADHDKYWHYEEDTGAQCVDDVGTLTERPNIVFVLADDWG